ncbi:MAG: GTP 3',8-cyclase MoaA [Mycobacteriales bacterium]
MPVSLGLPSPRRGAPAVRRPDSPRLIDGYGRIATDLRVSLTDRCNLRCGYCMPPGGLDWFPGEDRLTAEELLRLISIAVTRLGVDQVRFTGGEPLLRRDVVDIVAGCARLSPRPEIAITTNAIGLRARAAALAAAGLDRLNVSLDTVDAPTFATMTRRDFLPQTLDGIAAAVEAGFGPVKLNAVLLRGVNETQAPDLLEWALAHGHELRFIEQMPLDAQHGWDRADMVTAAEIRRLLSARFSLTLDDRPRGGAPAQRWLVDGGPATVGIIGSVTEPFCADCRRTRLTADGQVRNCLFGDSETYLRGPLRSGASDAELARLWREEMWAKAAGHGMNAPGFRQPARPMSAIGG